MEEGNEMIEEGNREAEEGKREDGVEELEEVENKKKLNY